MSRRPSALDGGRNIAPHSFSLRSAVDRAPFLFPSGRPSRVQYSDDSSHIVSALMLRARLDGARRVSNYYLCMRARKDPRRRARGPVVWSDRAACFPAHRRLLLFVVILALICKIMPILLLFVVIIV